MPYLKLNEQKLYYARHGRASSSSSNVLLVHGAGGTHLDWPPQLRQLPGTVTYAVDLFGHGRSDKPGRNSIEDYADDLFRIVELLQLSRVVIVGHSMGGAIAQTVGLRRPTWARGLVLIGSGARLRVADPILSQAAVDLPAAAAAITELAWAPETSPELVKSGHHNLLQNDSRVLHGDFSACNAFDVIDRAVNIELPTLIVCGSRDKLTPVKNSKHLAELIPTAQLFIVEGAGHMAALEQPEQVAHVVEEFVCKVTANDCREGIADGESSPPRPGRDGLSCS